MSDSNNTFRREVSLQNYTSFSGADLTVTVYVPPEKMFGLTLPSVSDITGRNALFDGMISQDGGFIVVGNLQTLSISSSRSVSPVRRLGESSVEIYTAGPRTIAGTMIFSMLYKNAFLDLFRRSRNEGLSEKFFVDMLPEMTIIIKAANEYGHIGRQVLTGVKIVNTGTTFSVDDMFTEETYTYVASFCSPFVPIEATDAVKKALSNGSLDRVDPVQVNKSLSTHAINSLARR